MHAIHIITRILKFPLKLSRDLGMSEKAKKEVVTSQYINPSPLVSLLFWTFLNPLKVVMEINILVCLLFR